MRAGAALRNCALVMAEADQDPWKTLPMVKLELKVEIQQLTEVLEIVNDRGSFLGAQPSARKLGHE